MRYYSNTASASTVANSGGISSGTTTLVLSTTNGMPSQFPFTLRIDPDTANEELVQVNSGAGTVGTPYSVTRGFDGTTAKSHTAGSPVVHSVSAIDFKQPQDHLSNVTPGAVHGLPASAWNNRIFVYKETDQSYNNDTTLNDDTALRAILQPNTNYLVTLRAQVTGLGGDIKIAWKLPGGITGLRQCLGPDQNSNSRYITSMASGSYDFSFEVRYGLGELAGYAGIEEVGLVKVGATGGELVIQYAQVTSHADLTTMRRTSYLLIDQVTLG